jgi:hypothetical protein
VNADPPSVDLSAEPPFRVFLLSPANLTGRRAAMVLSSRAQFDLARRLRSPDGASIGEVFAFVSGLYFRGKLAYANAFGRPPAALPQGMVISPAEGLRPLQEHVSSERLRAWAEVEVDARNARFTGPLFRAAERLERAYGSVTRFVLLGSIATSKYVKPLATVLGDHLLFPSEFVGRGDMSRGALLLRAARTHIELAYSTVEGSRLTTSRTPRIVPLD